MVRWPGVTAQLLAAASIGGTAPCPPTGCVEVAVDFTSAPLKIASTASTVEVDVMPFLGRTPEGGPFNAYFEALSNLGSDFVRYAPWCAWRLQPCCPPFARRCLLLLPLRLTARDS